MRWFAILPLILWASTAQAQTLVWDVPSGIPAFYTVTVDAQPAVSVSTPAWPVPVLSDGLHTFVVTACNSLGCGPASAPLSYTLPVPSPTPTPAPTPDPTPAPALCRPVLSPASVPTVAATGISGSLAIALEPDCAWTAQSPVGWLHVSLGSGTGPATVTYSVDPNPGAARDQDLAVAGATIATFHVAQLAGSTPSPTPTPTPVPPTPLPPASTCQDGNAVFPSGFVEWVYTKVGGAVASNTEYKRLVAAGWTYVDGSAYRVRANYYNLQFRCGA